MNTNPGRISISPWLGLAFGVMAVSTASIFIRFAQEEAPSLVIAAYRLSIATILISPLALIKYRQEIRQLSAQELGMSFISGIFLALHFAFWITSLEYTTVASSAVFVSTIPLWVALLSPFTIKESVSRFVMWGMLIALMGGVIIGLSDACQIQAFEWVCPPLTEFIGGTAIWGDMLAVIGAITAACYMLIGRRLRAKMSLVGYIFIVYGIASVVLLLMVGVAGYHLFSFSANTYLWMILLAVIPQLIGHSTINWALRYMSAAYVSIALLGEPVGSTILAYFLLSETPGELKIFGAILILTGIYMASREKKDK